MPTEIVLVTHSSKNSIENHFDTSFELEAMLEKRVKRQLLEEVQQRHAAESGLSRADPRRILQRLSILLIRVC
jgi:UTP-glucose-1-phosphate uridylyltransferase